MEEEEVEEGPSRPLRQSSSRCLIALVVRTFSGPVVGRSHSDVSTQEPFLWNDLWFWQFSLQWTMSTG